MSTLYGRVTRMIEPILLISELNLILMKNITTVPFENSQQRTKRKNTSRRNPNPNVLKRNYLQINLRTSSFYKGMPSEVHNSVEKTLPLFLELIFHLTTIPE